MGIHYNKGAELLDFVKNKEDFNMEGGFFKPLMKPGWVWILMKRKSLR